jgi:hypothetical protein
MKVIFGHPRWPKIISSLLSNAYRPAQFPTEREILGALALEAGRRNLQRAKWLMAGSFK